MRLELVLGERVVDGPAPLRRGLIGRRIALDLGARGFCPDRRIVRGVARASIRQQPRTWRYAFTRRRAGGPTPPNHGDEVGYVFGNLAASRTGAALPFDDRDTHVSDAMIGAWTRFAMSGDPNGGTLPAWPVYDAASDPYLELDSAIGAGRGWRTRHMDFLDRFYDSRAGGERA